MYDFKKLVCYILVLFFFLTTVFFLPVSGCKVIVAVNDATAGNYNLLLKVRDPSRLGLQVLCIVPAGYEYTYHHPWTGKPLEFTVRHKFIGVATKGDTLLNIVKAVRDIKRPPVSVVVKQADQVNVAEQINQGEQQVNIAKNGQPA